MKSVAAWALLLLSGVATADTAFVSDELILGVYADHSRAGDREYMKVHFPNLEYHEIPGTGHFLMLEKAEEFNRLVTVFVEKQKY